MPELDARKVELVGGGISDDGEHAGLIFTSVNGEQFALALRLDQFPEVVRVAALLHSEARKVHGDEIPPISVERWSTKETPDTAILSLHVFGGLELRFELSRQLRSSGSVSRSGRLRYHAGRRRVRAAGH